MSKNETLTLADGSRVAGCLTEPQHGGLHRIGALKLDREMLAGEVFYSGELAGAGKAPGYLADEWVSSPNQSSRGGTKVDRVIIHTMQATAASAISWFQNPASQVSTQYCIRESGSSVQMVGESMAAWGAGNSNYNQRSVQIETPGRVEDGVVTEVVYDETARITAGICHRHGIPADRQHIIGHFEVPNMVSVRTDPGNEWNWQKFIGLVKQYLSGKAPVKPTPQKPEPTGDVLYRVSAGGEQTGAFAVLENALEEVGAQIGKHSSVAVTRSGKA